MFRRLSLSVLALLAATTAHAQPVGATGPAGPPPVLTPALDHPVARFILVGDSTMQPGTGYGLAFCMRLKPNVECDNMAKGGRSTKSYRVDGSWAEVTAKLAKPVIGPDGNPSLTYVLIQLGTNDGSDVPERHTTMPEYATNLANYAAEVKAAGAIPVLITPVTQRGFTGGVLQHGLDPYAASVRQVGADTTVQVLDLYAESYKAVQTMGAVEAEYLGVIQPPAPEALAAAATGTSYKPPAPTPEETARRQAWMKAAQDAKAAGQPAPAPDPNAPKRVRVDYTHMGPKGAELFSSMVQRELTAALPQTAGYFAAPAQ
jgi:lysophospholipase L1-like esterase